MTQAREDERGTSETKSLHKMQENPRNPENRKLEKIKRTQIQKGRKKNQELR